MLLVFLDTETTGCDPAKHWPIEIAFKIIDSINFKTVASYESVISQSREIWAAADKESFDIHGFTFEETLKGKSRQVIEGEVTTYLNNAKIAQKSGVFICQNPSFDRPFFNKIVSPILQKQYQWPYHWLDLASMFFNYLYMHDKKKAEKLQESDLSKDNIAAYLDLPPETRPHRAMNGVNHLLACYEALFARYRALHAEKS